ncbi:MAG: helix-turn-helix domain-containing protein [Janthinobacterium lividum]
MNDVITAALKADHEMLDDPEEFIVAIPADPDDPEDRDISVAGLKRSHLARDLRDLRVRMGLTTDAFATRYGIPAVDYAGYESGYVRPPAAVSAYLRVIVAEPELAARVAARAA